MTALVVAFTLGLAVLLHPRRRADAVLRLDRMDPVPGGASRPPGESARCPSPVPDASGRPGGLRRGRPRRRSARAVCPPALVVDLVAAVLAAGASPRAAVLAVADGLEAVGDPAAVELTTLVGRLDSGRDEAEFAAGGAGQAPMDQLGEVLSLAGESGFAPAGLVRNLATELRRAEVARAAVLSARLPVVLVLPVGLCLLPAAVLLGVAPVVLDLLLGIVGGLG